MRLLLDTHALLWWLDGDAKLSPAARTAIGNTRAKLVYYGTRIVILSTGCSLLKRRSRA